MKRILLALIVLVMAAIVAASYAVRRAPEWLRTSLEASLGKSVSIGAIDFQFPNTFILSDVGIAESEGLFAGEPEFTAQSVRLTAMPTALRDNPLVIDSIDVRDASVVVRQSGRRLYHAFSNSQKVSPDSGRGISESASLPRRTLAVRYLGLHNGRIQFMDYDAGAEGFVLEAESVEVRVSEFHLPAASESTSFSVDGHLMQGREEKPAIFHISGVAAPPSEDSQIKARLQGLHLTYFSPYLSRVTSAVLEEGYLDTQMQATLHSQEVRVNAELAFSSLFFKSLEGNDELFGLSATQILEFLKDSSGRLRIPVSFRWNRADQSVRLRSVVRAAVETSLKETIFGNMGALLEKAIVRIGEKGLDAPQKTTESVLKKIKDFLKY